jgi:hypothetical protein
LVIRVIQRKPKQRNLACNKSGSQITCLMPLWP